MLFRSTFFLIAGFVLSADEEYAIKKKVIRGSAKVPILILVDQNGDKVADVTVAEPKMLLDHLGFGHCLGAVVASRSRSIGLGKWTGSITWFVR